MNHNLKLISQHFDPVLAGKKTSEIRFNDRNYQVGDIVTLNEGDLDSGEFRYTGRKVSARIGYISNYAVNDGFVCLSLNDVGLLLVE